MRCTRAPIKWIGATAIPRTCVQRVDVSFGGCSRANPVLRKATTSGNILYRSKAGQKGRMHPPSPSAPITVPSDPIETLPVSKETRPQSLPDGE